MTFYVRLINFIIIFIGLLTPTSPTMAIDLEGCRRFFNTSIAYSFYKLRPDNYGNLKPRMVRSGAGMKGQDFFKGWHPEGKILLFDKLVKESRDIVIDKAIAQAVSMYYMIGPQSSPTGRLFKHFKQNLPEIITPQFCRGRCDHKEEMHIQEKIREHVQRLESIGKEQYKLSEIAEMISHKISAINEQYRTNRTFDSYKHYVKGYFALFQGELGNFILPNYMRRQIGDVLLYEEFIEGSGDLHDSRIHRHHVEMAFESYEYFLNQSWGLGKHKLFELQELLPGDLSDDTDENEKYMQRILAFKELVETAPDIVLEAFRKNPQYNEDYCYIFNEVDNLYTHYTTQKESTNSNYYMAPIYVGMFAIPLLFGAGPLGILPVAFWALNGVTAVDMIYKFNKLAKKQAHVQDREALLQSSSRDKVSIQNYLEHSNRYMDHAKSIFTVLGLEAVGLGVSAKIYKTAEKVYKKLTHDDIVGRIKSILGSRQRHLLMKHNIHLPNQVDDFVRNAKPEEIEQLLLRSRETAIGKKVLLSETATEVAKQSYLLASGSIYEEINPASIWIDFVKGELDDNKKQMKIHRMISEDAISHSSLDK